MNPFTFNLRDQRQAAVDQVLLELEGMIPDLQRRRDQLANDPNQPTGQLELLDVQLETTRACQTSLKSERERLSVSDWTVADATYHWIFVDWLPQSRQALRALVASDPALQFRGSEPRLTPVFEQALVSLSIESMATPSALLPQVLNAAGGDSAQVDELLQTAHRLWLERGLEQSPYDSVCTLLPMRMETLFRNEAHGRELWLRLTPDEPSISRHRPLVTEIEAGFLQEFWTHVRQAIAEPGLAVTEWLSVSKAVTEWSLLCNRVGAARAAWLLTTFMPTVHNGDPQIQIPESNRGTLQQESHQPDRVVALPDSIEVWVIYDDGGVEVRRRLETVLQPEGGVRRPEDLSLPLPDSSRSPSEILNHWLTDFDLAIRVGLGAKLPLEPAMTPESIKALFVVGQSNESPNHLLQEHTKAGTLGVLRLGSATNSVHAAASVPLDKDPGAWWNVVQQRLGIGKGGKRFDLQRSVFHRVSKAFLGDETLPFCPLGVGEELDPIDDVLESHRFVRALWPAMWGHFLRDHSNQLPGLAANANDFWFWSIDNLWPEGPLPPVRIHDQPYGLLPTASLTDWVTDGNEEEWIKQLEPRLAKGLSRMRREMVTNSQPPTTIGADTVGLLNVMGRDAVTHKYIIRYWMRYEFFRDFFSGAMLPEAISAEALWKGKLIAPLGGRQPQLSSPHLTLGWEYLDLPLIDATRRRLGLPLHELLMELIRIDWVEFMQGPMRRIVPDSLCIRLMMESVMLARAWQGQEKPDGTMGPLINRVRWDDDVSIKRINVRLAKKEGPASLDKLVQDMLIAGKELGEFLDQGVVEADDPFSEQGERIWRMETPASRLAQLERAFRATLDAASYRIDPWVTGLAWRRLENYNRSPRRLHTLGVYGWLDGPFRGSPGPTSAGLLHAPSQAQAITSIVLRDKFLSAQSDGAVAQGASTWEMKIESAVARKAMELAEECRLGFHLFEVVGHKVETIVDNFQQVRTLRLLRPQYPERPDGMVVCHGCHALESLMSAQVQPEPGLEQIRESLSLKQREELRLLHSGLDAFADLSVADGVHHLVTARAQHAAETMDGTSGFGQPPTLESIRTPPSGYRVHTTVISAFQWVEAPSDPRQLPPSRVAEPSLAATLHGRFSQADRYVWKVFSAGHGNSLEGMVGSVSLAELGLAMVDAALMPQVLLAQIVCAKLQLDQPFETFEVIAAEEYFVCRQLWGAMGQCPVGRDNLQTAKQLAQSGPQSSTVQHEELATKRFRVLRQQLAGLATQAQQLAEAAEDQADSARRLMREILSWGIVPTLSPQSHDGLLRFVFANIPAMESDLRTWLTGVTMAIEDRLKRTESEPEKRLNALAKQIAELASSDGKMSILSKWTKAELLSATEIEISAPNTTLDTQWLTVTASVRPALARLESLQLQAEVQGTHQPLVCWTNGDPKDPWHREFIRARILARAVGQKSDFRLRESTPHLFASYGTNETWEGTEIAIGLIDEFGENVPIQERQTYAAWGFNAPASRPQQAILIAVPSVPRTPLTNESLLQVLVETRELARARAVRPEDMQPPNGLLPSMWFQAAGVDRVRLGLDTQYWQ